MAKGPHTLTPYESLTTRGKSRRIRPLALAALAEFGLPVDRLSAIKHLVNTTYHLRSNGRTCLVRVHRAPDYTPAWVASELDWLTALSEVNDLQVQTPHRTPDGRGVVAADAPGVPGPYPVTVLSWLRGGVRQQRERNPKQYASLGRLIGLLHDHAMRWKPPAGFDRPLYDAVHQIGSRSPRPLPVLGPKYLSKHVLRDMEETYERRVAAEEKLGRGRDQFGLAHMDLSFSNILYSGNRAIPIDFDAAGFGFYAYDLAVVLAGPFALHDFTERCAAVFEGYRSVRPLPDEWIEHLPAMMGSRTATYILHVAHSNPEAVESQWRALLRPLLETSLDRFPR